VDDERDLWLTRQLEALRAQELRRGGADIDLVGRLRRVADGGLALVRSDDRWDRARQRVWDWHLLEAEATARTGAPAAFSRDVSDVVSESGSPWVRSTLLRLTPELLALEWGPVDEYLSSDDVANDLLAMERVVRHLRRSRDDDVGVAAAVRGLLASDVSALGLARRLQALGVSRLSSEDSVPSVAHGREVQPLLVEEMDLTELEVDFARRVHDWREGRVATAQAYPNVALHPGRFGPTRRRLLPLAGVLPIAWRGRVSRWLALAGRPPRR